MNRLVHRLAMAGLVSAIACSSSSGAPVLGMTFTLQGVIADATNGSRIGGNDLQLYLVQGATIRGPSRLITNTNDPLAGEYAFTGIPVEFNLASNMWKLVAIKGGYQRFESEFNLKVVGNPSIVDTAYSKIGNIYLFPVGAKVPDYVVTATYNGKPVPNATVQLDPVSASNTSAIVTSGAGDTLTATNGYLASLAQTTNTTGKATFLGTTLSVGAAYKVTVLPVSFTDSAGTTVQLGTLYPTGTVIAGLGTTDIQVQLSNLAPNGAVLYVTGASNRATGQLAPDGKLTVTFNAPVSLVNPTKFTATLNAGTNAAGNAAGAGVLSNTAPVTATLSPDGLTLVLAPNYSTPPASTDRGVSITYNNGTAQIVARDYPAISNTLINGGLTFSDGSTVSGFVAITGQ